MPEILTAHEVAELLGLSPWTVYDLARRRAIPHLRIGRRVLFRWATVLNWLEDQEAASLKKDAPAATEALR